MLPCFHSGTGPRWWLRGKMSSSLANNVIALIQDMAVGNLSESWSAVTKAAIAEAILALTKLEEGIRIPQLCIKTPAVSLNHDLPLVLNFLHKLEI